MHPQMTSLADAESETPISEFLLRIEGDEARLRNHGDDVIVGHNVEIARSPVHERVARAHPTQPYWPRRRGARTV